MFKYILKVSEVFNFYAGKMHKDITFFDLISLAAKKDTFIQKYPQYEKHIEDINNIHPKFLEWGIKQLGKNHDPAELVSAITEFNKIQNSLPSNLRDINSFQDLTELQNILKETEFKKKEKEEKRKRYKVKVPDVSDYEVLYEDESFVLGHPKTKEACVTKGSGTKWCITMRNEDHYEYYHSNNDLFYFLYNKELDTEQNPKDNNPLYKIAFRYKRDIKNNKIIDREIYDAQDKLINWSDVPNMSKWNDLIKQHVKDQPPSDIYYLEKGILNLDQTINLLDHYDDDNIFVLKKFLNDKYLRYEEVRKKLLEFEPIKRLNEKIPDYIWNVLGKEEDLAKNPNTPDEILKLLAKDNDKDIRYYVSINPSTPVEALLVLSEDNNTSVKNGVSENPNTPVEVLELLAQDDSFTVRRGVAINPSTPFEILEILAQDNDELVRNDVADNPNTPVKILRLLAQDNNRYIRHSVAKNPNTPLDILELLAQDSDAFTRQYVAQNPNAPFEILQLLAQDNDELTKRHVAWNPNTPVEILELLAKDNDELVRNDAKQSLSKKTNIR